MPGKATVVRVGIAFGRPTPVAGREGHYRVRYFPRTPGRLRGPGGRRREVKPWYGGAAIDALGEGRDDGIERTVHLAGERPEVEPGDRMTVVATLRLVRHAEDTVGGVKVPAWVEIRAEEHTR